jgi:EpsI family protein
MRKWQAWIPAGVLASGVLLNGTLVARRAGTTPLVASLTTVADTVMGVAGRVIEVDSAQVRVAGFSDYILREFAPAGVPEFSVYVGYYDEQRQGKSIHSPRNCLPGSGWDPVGQSVVTVPTPNGPVQVNRYEVVNGQRRAIVYYWYQGRGRVAHNEYAVKYELLRDAALYGRTEEALVRIVIGVDEAELTRADSVAVAVAGPLVADVARVLPPL